jgi:signal transduction histidine kinase
MAGVRDGSSDEARWRRGIADQIHDEPLQALTAAHMRLQLLRDELDDPQQLRQVDELERNIKRSIDQLRELMTELRADRMAARS